MAGIRVPFNKAHWLIVVLKDALWYSCHLCFAAQAQRLARIGLGTYGLMWACAPLTR